MKNRRVVLVLAIVAVVGLGYLVNNWYYLPGFYLGYGRDYNEERVKIDQPIIEDYFLPKKEGAIRRQIWITPDSLKDKYVHLSKYFNTSKGEIIYEFDFYALNQDSTRWLLKREYFFNQDSVAYEFKKSIKEEKEVLIEITKSEGDSILNEWMKDTPPR